MAKTAIIIGAGPAGLTSAYELLEKTDIVPIIFEQSNDIGGISKTVRYKGNRMDIGGHRFFSKSDVVMGWWANIMSTQGAPSKDDLVLKRNIEFNTGGPDPEKTDDVMLIRTRLSRILHLRKFFDYPISISAQTIKNLGLIKTAKIGFSYIYSRFFPIKKENSLEDFFINRFGKELYSTFFKDYTKKLWGVPCNKLPPEWGAQRVKGLSVSKAILHFFRTKFSRKSTISQKDIETSLIQRFLYPKFGPGQMWEKVAAIVEKKGGKIHKQKKVTGLEHKNGKIINVSVFDQKSKKTEIFKADYFFSTMPVKDLVLSFAPPPKKEVLDIAEGLMYRDFITVGVLLKRLKIKNQTKTKTIGNIIPDNWIYVQERDVKLGRIQVFNNWSPYLVKDLENTVWLGLEYFCSEGDSFWNKTDKDLSGYAVRELEKIGVIEAKDVIDSTVIRMPKTYPSYFGTYNRFDTVQQYTDGFENLFLIGRNGMHKYNNMDHSMLAAITAVSNIIDGKKGKANIWTINTEQEYHEEKSG
ncbi:MAG: NAD(P)/FAD-dependent oxidoreductase [Nanoarchaeota archaeon]|nr:NAD(P)/FAD-dependent oxidoreductase [Nanoarchaeota archaeon]